MNKQSNLGTVYLMDRLSSETYKSLNTIALVNFIYIRGWHILPYVGDHVLIWYFAEQNIRISNKNYVIFTHWAEIKMFNLYAIVLAFQMKVETLTLFWPWRNFFCIRNVNEIWLKEQDFLYILFNPNTTTVKNLFRNSKCKTIARTKLFTHCSR